MIPQTLKKNHEKLNGKSFVSCVQYFQEKY
jgi:hypothetical protein